ncbi:hypothetical protein ABIB73_005091 [Bradyrhizobium sp. F1.4.3]
MADVHRLFRVPGVMSGLHPDPDAGSASKQLSNAHRHLRGQGLLLCHDVVKMLPRNAQQARDLDLGLAGGRQHVFAKHRPGMSGTAMAVFLGRIFGHDAPGLVLVILLEIDSIGIAVLEFECDAPRSIHMDCVSDRLPVQTVEVKAKHVHVLRKRSAIELIEPPQNSGAHLRIDLHRLSFRPKIAKSLVPEGLDQGAAKNPTRYKRKLFAYFGQGGALN